MQKSLFKKFFGFSMILILVAMLVLGGMLLGFSGNFWLKEKRTLLLDEASAVADVAATSLDDIDSASFAAVMQMMSGMMSSSTNSEILVVEPSGRIYVTGSNHEVYTGKTVPKEIMTQALTNDYNGFGSLGSVLQEDCYIVGVPIRHLSGTRGAVFAATSSSSFTDYLFNMLKIFLLASMVVVTLVFIAVYFITVSMVRPVRAMAEAARCMSRGDFSRRIVVDREDEIGQLAVAFNNMTMSIAAGEQMRRGFIANVSHELKTPMTTISGFIDGILDGTIESKEQKRYLEIVSQEVKRLARLVVSMLSLSKLEAGEMKISPAPIKFSDTILNVLLGFEKRIEEKGLEIQGLEDMEPITLTADPDLMHQVIYNLVDNAIKYTPQEGYIRISTSHEGGKTSFVIRNSGKGIARQDLPHVFERFYKVDKSRGTDKQGAGLGLYLVKTIISLHGGQITVRSVEGEYCEFVVALDDICPMGADGKPEQAAPEQEPKSKNTFTRKGTGKEGPDHE